MTKKRKTQQSKRLHKGQGQRPQSLQKMLSKLKTKYHVPDRVRVKFEGIKKRDIACDTGTIVGIKWKFMKSDTHRVAIYQVVFDEPYFKQESVLFSNVPHIWTYEKALTRIKEDSKS